MSQQFGGPSRRPGRPQPGGQGRSGGFNRPQGQDGYRPPQFQYNEQEGNGAEELQSLSDEESYPQTTRKRRTAVTVERIEPRKRLVALVFDCMACYFVAIMVSLIPFLHTFVSMQLVIALMLLIKDFFYQGRGIGKNMMGLQVVDVKTGKPPTLIQVCIRNGVLLAPFIALQIVHVILSFNPIPLFNTAIMQVVNIIGMLYVLIVVPLEIYRSYNRDDGLRYGDELAGTAIIESSMDFSTPVGK